LTIPNRLNPAPSEQQIRFEEAGMTPAQSEVLAEIFSTFKHGMATQSDLRARLKTVERRVVMATIAFMALGALALFLLDKLR
jgi:hypothetical protein